MAQCVGRDIDRAPSRRISTPTIPIRGPRRARSARIGKDSADSRFSEILSLIAIMIAVRCVEMWRVGPRGSSTRCVREHRVRRTRHSASAQAPDRIRACARPTDRAVPQESVPGNREFVVRARWKHRPAITRNRPQGSVSEYPGQRSPSPARMLSNPRRVRWIEMPSCGVQRSGPSNARIHVPSSSEETPTTGYPSTDAVTNSG